MTFTHTGQKAPHWPRAATSRALRGRRPDRSADGSGSSCCRGNPTLKTTSDRFFIIIIVLLLPCLLLIVIICSSSLNISFLSNRLLNMSYVLETSASTCFYFFLCALYYFHVLKCKSTCLLQIKFIFLTGSSLILRS